MQAMPVKNGHSADFEHLGRASVLIVHDIKNQLNGLKLYATFLRKRLDRDERPQDERETIAKLMAGLDRAANDLTAIVRYAQPQEIKYQKRVDLLRLIAKALDEPAIESSFSKDIAAVIDAHPESLHGDFDSSALVAAIRILAERASIVNNSYPLSLTVDRVGDPGEARIEWRITGPPRAQDPFMPAEGIASVRLALAGRTVEAHGGRVEHDAGGLRVWLPLIK
jgi:signal transduction histidine kinase